MNVWLHCSFIPLLPTWFSLDSNPFPVGLGQMSFYKCISPPPPKKKWLMFLFLKNARHNWSYWWPNQIILILNPIIFNEDAIENHKNQLWFVSIMNMATIVLKVIIFYLCWIVTCDFVQWKIGHLITNKTSYR